MKKTTILLQEEVYEKAKEEYGNRKMSQMINKLLREQLIKGKIKKGLFGVDKSIKPFKREHIDRI